MRTKNTKDFSRSTAPSAYSVLTMIRPVAELVIYLARKQLERDKQWEYLREEQKYIEETIKKIQHTLGISR